MITKVEGMSFLDDTPVSIEIVGGKISRTTPLSRTKAEYSQLDYIAPGFIDNQVNGYLSVDFSSPGLSVEKIRKATRALWKTGVTTYLPTLITSSRERLLENASILAQAARQPGFGLSIPGFHLEGPYISPADGFRGVHDNRWIREPDWDEFQELNESAGNGILQVTLAPEIDGAIDFIHKCRRAGIIVALGHHNGSAEVIARAVDAGASIATHFGNGCANMIHRHHNPLWPQLADDRLMISIIADGHHLTPEELRVFIRAKKPERILLTSDMTCLAGMPPGKYVFNDRDVVLTPDGMIKMQDQDCLAGASFPVIKGVENILRLTDCSLPVAINMATKNPARICGMEDRGEIVPGKRADLVLFTLNGSTLTIKKTIVAGEVVYSSDSASFSR